MLITKKCTFNGILAVLIGLLVLSSCENKEQKAYIYETIPAKLWESECDKIVSDEFLRIQNVLEDYADDAIDEYEDIETYDDLEEYLATYVVASFFGMEDFLPDFEEDRETKIMEYEIHSSLMSLKLLNNMGELIPPPENLSRPATTYSDEALCEILLGTPASIADPPEDVQQNIAWSIVANLLADKKKPSITSCSYDRKNKIWIIRMDNAPNQTVSFFKRDDGDYDFEWNGQKQEDRFRPAKKQTKAERNSPSSSEG